MAISPTGHQFNIKMPSYQYRKSHCGDKKVVRWSYLHNGISYIGKMALLYWISPLVSPKTQNFCNINIIFAGTAILCQNAQYHWHQWNKFWLHHLMPSKFEQLVAFLLKYPQASFGSCMGDGVMACLINWCTLLDPIKQPLFVVLK